MHITYGMGTLHQLTFLIIAQGQDYVLTLAQIGAVQVNRESQ
jgi:hypothetical protein